MPSSGLIWCRLGNIGDHTTVIADLDGTLYRQFPVRVAMLAEMLLHFWRFRDFLIVRKYRKLYEAGIEEEQRYASLPARAREVIREWMIDRPLKYLKRFRNDGLCEKLNAAMDSGITVVVYSDYPVKEKLEALDFHPSYAFSAEDAGCLKPDASGIIRLLQGINVKAEDCLVIGDREDKDGALAAAMGCDCVIVGGEDASGMPGRNLPPSP